jgi:metal-responsive CopG/Arc/MetJ family transcriptional regulator
MRQKRSRATNLKAKPAVRASISFPPDVYKTLENMARLKKVSVAWVVRDAAEKYVAEPSKPEKEFSHG